ncbi:MAG TPA: hypothetical protein VNX21_09080 [Candidatus Thermoplasmatota archaeon]|nr:hypothetical protein [Candidatus Thermoplasmatota archaeon]
MKPTLLVDAALALAIALLYARVGLQMQRRLATTRDGARALRSFALWWHALAALTALGALRSLLGGLDVLHRAPHATLTFLGVLLLPAALAGLVDYLAYIYAGTPRWRRPIYAAHAAMAAFFLGLVVWMHPIGVAARDWSVPIQYENQLGGPLLALALALVLAPVLAGSAAYLTLAFRVRDPTARFRIVTVSGAFLAWFGSAALANALGWSQWYWWPLVARGIALGATLLILLAYNPPRALRTRMERRGDGGAPPARPAHGPRLAPAASGTVAVHG